jgi:hypothetical protein
MWVWQFKIHHKMVCVCVCFFWLQRFLAPVSVWDMRFFQQEYMEKLDCACGGMLGLLLNSQDKQ